MWAVRVLAVLLLAVTANVCFWAVLPRYGVKAPAWFVLGFDVLFVVPLFWALPSMAPRPGRRPEVTGEALGRWRRGSLGTYPSVDESFDRLHRAGWSVGEVATATRWLVDGSNVQGVWLACAAHKKGTIMLIAPSRPLASAARRPGPAR
jgi:hypothetical protein